VRSAESMQDPNAETREKAEAMKDAGLVKDRP